MNRTLLVFAMATAGLVAVPSLSHAADEKSGFFVNGSVGQATLNKGFYDDSDTGYQANAGYRWAFAPEFAFGIEGGYTHLGKFSPDSNFVAPPPAILGVGDAEIRGWTLGLNAHWNVNDTWYISGRTGLFSADIRVDNVALGIPLQDFGNSNDWYAGAGFGYDFSNNFSLGLNYDYYKAGERYLNLDTGLVSVSGEVRF